MIAGIKLTTSYVCPTFIVAEIAAEISKERTSNRERNVRDGGGEGAMSCDIIRPQKLALARTNARETMFEGTRDSRETERNSIMAE